MSRSRTSERGLQAFAWALASVGALIVVFAFADLILTNLPAAPERVEWRYQVIGRLSQMVITAIFGMTFVLGAAVLARSSAGARIVSVLAYLGAVALAGLTVLFVLDTADASAMVPETARSVFQMGGIRAILKNVLAVGCLVVMGWAGGVNARAVSGSATRPGDPKPLVTS